MVDLNPDIFRAYDIRGQAGTDLTEASVEAIGWAIAVLVAGEIPGSFVIGGDSRQSTPTLKEALIRGITGAGSDVVDIGLATSPLVYYGTAEWQATGGVNVTGSHNPPQQNGLKVTRSRAMPLSSEEIQQVYRLARDDYPSRAARKPGEVIRRQPADEYLKFVAGYVTEKNGSLPAGYKVVVDCGNGTAALVAQELFHRLGCEVVELFGELKAYPDRGSDPTIAENIRTLRAGVPEYGADLGVAFDGDADRISIVGSDGRQIAAEYALLILARDMLGRHPGATVLFDVRCSANVPKDITAHGGHPYMYKTGHSLIKREMNRLGIMLAGEGSGHIFFGEDYYGVDDGLIAAAAVTAIAANSGMPVEALLKDLPSMALSPDFRIKVPEADKYRLAAEIGAELKKRYTAVEVDGIRADFGGGWALVRASNTEANIVIRAEAETGVRLREILSEVESAFIRHLPAEALNKLREYISDRL
jgi:phosphomannomutase/phosphoglucomutase